MNAPALIPVSTAQLPRTYEAAKRALSECSEVDECKDWADKAAALASYGRQAKDDQLVKLAQRIQARAIRRSGEILKQIESQQGGDRKSEEYQRAGDHLLISRTDAARDAGMSPHQAKQAVRVANIPEEDFNAQVDGDFAPLTDSQQEKIDATLHSLSIGAITRDQSNARIAKIDPDWAKRIKHRPPTLTQLAQQGIQRREAPPPDPQTWLKGRDPKVFNRALHFTGDITDYAATAAKWDLSVLHDLDDEQRMEIRNALRRIDAIHDQIATRI